MDALQYLSDVSEAESFGSPRSRNSRIRKRSKHKHSSSKHIKSEPIDSGSDTNHSHRSKIASLCNDKSDENNAEKRHKRRHRRRKASTSPVSDLDLNHAVNKEYLRNDVHEEEGGHRRHHSRSRSHKRHKSHHKQSKSRHRHRERDGSIEHRRKSKKRHRRRSESSSSSASDERKGLSVKQERQSPSMNGVLAETRVPDASRWEDSVSRSRDSSRRPQTADVTRVKREASSGSEGGEPHVNDHHRDSSSQNGVRHQNGREQWGRPQEVKKEENVEPEEKAKPNLGLSGKLTEDTNTYKGVVIKYSQPAEARKPKRRWRWYIFKGDEELPYLPLHRQSAYLIGRERRVVDVPTDHPSCSKQHAVLQYRLVRYTREDNTIGRTVKPYIIDLDSANGTYVNNRRITPRSYVELMEKDVVKFGYSSREYVLLHETSKDSDVDTADAGLDMSPVSALMSMTGSSNP